MNYTLSSCCPSSSTQTQTRKPTTCTPKPTSNDLNPEPLTRIAQGDMARLMAFGIGADLPPDFAEMTLDLTMKGKKVVGNDKKNATVTLKFAILESLR
jgi:hypothetical protein